MQHKLMLLVIVAKYFKTRYCADEDIEINTWYNLFRQKINIIY